jgi:hypothetical protein
MSEEKIESFFWSWVSVVSYRRRIDRIDIEPFLIQGERYGTNTAARTGKLKIEEGGRSKVERRPRDQMVCGPRITPNQFDGKSGAGTRWTMGRVP